MPRPTQAIAQLATTEQLTAGKTNPDKAHLWHTCDVATYHDVLLDKPTQYNLSRVLAVFFCQGHYHWILQWSPSGR
eukprot:COSAG05_NODE_21137_length_274_cov_0.594286_1_plen_75_part_10